jgi:hypothetical protein
MRGLAATSVLLLVLANGAVAQETYQELYESGELGDLSQVETQMARLLRAHGVPDTCLGMLTFPDVGNIYQIVNSEESTTTKHDRVQAILEDKCS